MMVDHNPDFIECLNKGRLVEVGLDPGLVDKELSLAQQDSVEAQASIERGSTKWATVQSYYAMFHAARALVLQKGYREKSHRCLAIALRELYVRAGTLEERLLVELEDARALREEADYRGVYSETSAMHSVQVAREFVETTTKLLSGTVI